MTEPERDLIAAAEAYAEAEDTLHFECANGQDYESRHARERLEDAKDRLLDAAIVVGRMADD